MSEQRRDDRKEIELLRQRVEELEETLRAIRSGEVDALIVPGGNGKRVFTLQGADHPYQELIEGMSEAAVTFNPDGFILYCNLAFADLVGRPLREILGGAIRDYFRDSDLLRFERIFKLSQSGRVKIEVDLFKRDETTVPVQLSLSHILLGEVPTACMVVTDLTASREAEEFRRRELALSKSNEELENFASIASHDLQAPLNKVLVFGDLARANIQKGGSDKAVEYLDKMQKAGEVMRQLIQNLLKYSRVTSEQAPVEDFDPSEIIDYVLSNYENVIAAEKITVETASAWPPVRANRSQFLQLMQNLVANAVKFRIPSGARVSITARREDGVVRFTVADNGIGIDPRNSHEIFDMFRRLHSSSKYSGSGLGLAICKKIIDRHGGRIWVESKVGEGSTFYFTLPAAS